MKPQRTRVNLPTLGFPNTNFGDQQFGQWWDSIPQLRGKLGSNPPFQKTCSEWKYGVSPENEGPHVWPGVNRRLKPTPEDDANGCWSRDAFSSRSTSRAFRFDYHPPPPPDYRDYPRPRRRLMEGAISVSASRADSGPIVGTSSMRLPDFRCVCANNAGTKNQERVDRECAL